MSNQQEMTLRKRISCTFCESLPWTILIYTLQNNMINSFSANHLPAISLKRFIVLFAGLQDAISKNLLVSDKNVLSARVLAMNASTGSLVNSAWWQRQGVEMGGPRKVTETDLELGQRPNTDYPWYEDADSSPALRSPKFIESAPNVSYKGWWTYPYYSCNARRWLISYSVPIPPPGRRG